MKTILALDPRPADVTAALLRAFAMVGWDPSSRKVPRVEDLTEAQRELLLRLGDRDLDLHRFFVPASGLVRQRWLGVVRGGRLEREHVFTVGGKPRAEPLWRAAVEVETNAEALASLLDSLSLEDRLHAFGEVNAAIGWGPAYGIPRKLFFDWWDPSLLARLGAEGEAWAPAFADALLAQVAKRSPGEHGWVLTSDLCWPVFLALVRARVPIEPRWDALLPIGGQDAIEPCVECVRAIPEDRRTAAIVGALKRELEPVSVGLPLLARFPSSELARLIRRSTGGAGIPKAKILAELERLAEQHAVIREALAPRAGAKTRTSVGKPKPVVLSCTAVVRPRSFAELSTIHRLQLEIAGKRTDGRSVGAEARFAEEGYGPGFLEICKLSDDAGKHRYDALLFRADSGVVFEARAKRVVAEIIQDGVECKTAALRDALDAALADRAERSG